MSEEEKWWQPPLPPLQIEHYHEAPKKEKKLVPRNRPGHVKPLRRKHH